MIIMNSNKKYILFFTILTTVLLFSVTFMAVNNLKLTTKLDKQEDLNSKYDDFLDDLAISQPEDAYEENDVRTSAYYLGGSENVWLSNIGGFGVQNDNDWYEIYITASYLRLVVHLCFTDADGDIDITVYDSGGSYVTQQISITDNEYIDYLLPSSGTYYLLVHGASLGNTYDLLWDDLLPAQTDDGYEENDLRTTAYDLTGSERQWLSSSGYGLGMQVDADWYEIYANFDALRLMVYCIFSDAAGNIDIELYNSVGTLLQYSWSTTDNEYLDYIVSGEGTYYILVYWGNGGNTYDLWWDDVSTTDDWYEENDLRTSAYSLSENTWLSSILGFGIQSDYDYYQITVSPGEELLSVYLSYSYASGNIDLALYNSVGSYITSSTSLTDEEYIIWLLASGTYYLLVYGDDYGNLYDLWWDDLAPPSDDVYEENDYYYSAYDLTIYETDWLSEVHGLGIQGDDDWYEISITSGYEHLIVNCTFSDAAGDIDIAVYASDGTTRIAYSWSITDNEYIDVLLPSSGTYFIRVYGADAGNLYDLWWDDLIRPSDDNYEENDVYSSAYSIIELYWLAEQNGAGIQGDDDWYQITITTGYEHLIVDLRFTHAGGDIDLQVVASDGSTVIAGSLSKSDNEYIDVLLPSSGTYYIRVFGTNVGNLYNLWWDDLFVITEDNYEENDDYTTAYDLSTYEQYWLDTIDGYGLQADDDWYEIDITSGFENLTVICTFSHAAGDIDLQVYASDGSTLITGSASVTDNEYIITVLPSSGTYYIRVYGANAGNTYNLWWDDTAPSVTDDNYEQNDSPVDAYDLTAQDGVWLSTIAGMGIQSDYDWYEIYVPGGSERVVIECTFTHALGNINIQLWNSTYDGLWGSITTTDDEYIDYIVPSAGTYYILVYGDDAGNTYDLMWDALTPVVDDAYEENDFYTGAYDLTSYPDTWLTDISGPGIQADFDYYKVSISTPNQRIIIDVTYTYSEGALVLILTDNLLTPLAQSNTTANTEHIDTTLTSTGTFYIIVAGLGAGNSYDLKYSLTAAGGQKPIPGYNVIFLIAMVFGISIIVIRKRFMKLTRN